MDPNQLHVDSFEHELVIPTNIQSIVRGLGFYEFPPFPSGSYQTWVGRIVHSNHPYLEIIPRNKTFVCGKFSISYNNDELGCIYYYNNGTCDPKFLSITKIPNAIACTDTIKIKASVVVEPSIHVCKASIVVESSTGVPLDAQVSKSLLKISEDFKSLYDSKQNTDITFCVKDKDIKAHKAILIARSEVFAAMFENQLEECQSGKISITDADDDVIEEMLRYMYTGKVPNLDTINSELLEFAEKYQLDDLKERCLESLRTHITIEKAANTLILADRYRSEELKRHVIKYIIANVKGVTDTTAWKDMISTNGHLIEETFRALALGIKPLHFPSSRSIMVQNQLHVDSFEHEFEIPITSILNFITINGASNSILFPSGNSGQQWVARVCRNQDCISYMQNSYPCLQITPKQKNFVCGKFSLSYNDAKLGCIYYNKNGTSDPKELSIAKIYNAIRCTNTISNVKIICKANIVVESFIGVSLGAQASKSLHKMREDFERLYDSQQASDITLCVKDKDIKAHKAILIARSEVFAAMFRNGMKESQSGKIAITDTDDEVIEEMLLYMYTGKVSKLDTMTTALLECADTYQMDDLKESCLKSLQTHITIEKAANTLILADRYRSEELKRHVIKYIIANVKGVTDTTAWKDMISTNAHLIEETFRTLALGPTVKE